MHNVLKFPSYTLGITFQHLAGSCDTVEMAVSVGCRMLDLGWRGQMRERDEHGKILQSQLCSFFVSRCSVCVCLVSLPFYYITFQGVGDGIWQWWFWFSCWIFMYQFVVLLKVLEEDQYRKEQSGSHSDFSIWKSLEWTRILQHCYAIQLIY